MVREQLSYCPFLSNIMFIFFELLTMNTLYFISLVASITFATGFMVATIIWGINRAFSPGMHNGEATSESFLNLIFSNRIIKEYKRMLGQYNNSNSKKKDLENQELYTYYHGKN